jgi:hypothetical protein
VAALEQLNLGNNSLSGTLPPQLSQLTSLQSLHLDNNNFKGTLPAGLGQLTDMKIADFSYNHLQGDLPSELSAWSNLISLLIQHNYFEGVLPKNYSRLGRLTTFDASSNSFASRFDDFIQPLMMKESKCSVFSQPTGCYMLNDLRASNNSFYGEIGSFIVLATGLRTLDLSSNALGGSLPNVTGEVMFDLSVSSGYFRFVLIPPAWVTIDVHGNENISGSIPEDWSMLSEVQLIDVRKTDISFALNTKKKTVFNFTYSHARGDITFYPSLSASCPTITGKTQNGKFVRIAVDPENTGFGNCSCSDGYGMLTGINNKTVSHVICYKCGKNDDLDIGSVVQCSPHNILVASGFWAGPAQNFDQKRQCVCPSASKTCPAEDCTSQIITVRCPAGKCCIGKDQCQVSVANSGDMCAPNRNASFPLCSKCLDGFSATFGTGACVADCTRTSPYFVLGTVFGSFMCISFFLMFSLPKQKSPNGFFSISAYFFQTAGKKSHLVLVITVYCGRTANIYYTCYARDRLFG